MNDEIAKMNTREQAARAWIGFYNADCLFRDIRKGNAFKFRREDDSVLIKTGERSYKCERGHRWRTGINTAVCFVDH